MGSILEADGRSSAEIEKRISTGRKIIGMLNSVLWSKNIVHNTKRIIYNSLVQSVMLYGAETWTLDRPHANKLLSTEMDYWRRAARKSRMDKVRNQRIREIMKVDKNILEVIEERKLRWFGHITRMGEDRIPKMILEWNAEGRRRRGKPQEKWMDGIKRSMNRLELTEEDAQDRNVWKNKITVKK